jgi:hypothetical protein
MAMSRPAKPDLLSQGDPLVAGAGLFHSPFGNHFTRLYRL